MNSSCVELWVSYEVEVVENTPPFKAIVPTLITISDVVEASPALPSARMRPRLLSQLPIVFQPELVELGLHGVGHALRRV